jgi:poly(3-hydroxybutyrate) depolymerase
VALVLLVLAACGGGSGRPAARASVDTGRDVHLDVPGGDVTVHVPAKASHIGMVVLHGFLESQKEVIDQGWSGASDRHGFIAIYPNRSISWNAGVCCGDASVTKRDDVSWLVTTLDKMRTEFGLSAIYLAGNSNGGMMIERLLAERPNVSDRFALWAAAPEMPIRGTWAGHGYLFARTLDPVVPRAGGVATIGGLRTRIRPSADTGKWLIGAHLTFDFTTGYGHGTPAGWPDVAWAALSKPQ